jgi:hypothetical protein
MNARFFNPRSVDRHADNSWSASYSSLTPQAVAGQADHGRRAAVAGGQQMDGFCQWIAWLLVHNGLENTRIHTRSNRELPGYFRATKDWAH